MSIRPKQAAEKDFSPFLSVFHEAVVEGHRDYARKYGPEASTHRRNTKRTIIRDHIVKRLRAALEGQRGVWIREARGTTYFGFFGRWQVHVRMLRRQKMSVVLNRTQLALAIQMNAESAPPLGFHFQGTTKLYLGYVSPEEPANLEVAVVCPDGRRNAWELSIEPPREAEVVRFEPKAPAPDDDILVRLPAKEAERERDE